MFQVRKLSYSLSHPMNFFHTYYVHIKKSLTLYYIFIYYWQLQVGPDHPRPDEPQRVLICRQIQDLAPEAAASPAEK